MSIERIHPDALFQFDGMAQVVAAVGHKTLYISGQTAMDKHMNLVGGNDYYAQASAAFANLKIALAAGGASYQNLVSTTIHIKDIGPVAFEGIQKAMHEAFDGKPIPEHAMTMIGATLGSPESLLEVVAVAVI
ncbi:MAG: RidA family protein [Gammaproteobacteria bacterium]|jgi:enamine deaminase RidA (YjgF/YER057c/UK114 family)|nr:RidA family protein [Gammaproteobacteria bacterium]MBP6053620.1 RidA family protein [Pseudomonadales bacterium]MBK7170846.1 RidA family protein [Gammaproteobacteria bacterium]MBK7519471.1 RidA family protein [Gammaproteobacteria bacterium]MBK7729779.1 RidA family protein [Gammaproteobacteria bacterium]